MTKRHLQAIVSVSCDEAEEDRVSQALSEAFKVALQSVTQDVAALSDFSIIVREDWFANQRELVLDESDMYIPASNQQITEGP